MISHNKLDKSFGPVGSFSGIIVFVAGLASVWFSLFSLLLLVIGAFVGFTYSSTEVDSGQKRVRFLNNLFGIIKTGEWLNVKPDMKIGIRRSGKIWRTYSGGNRTLDSTTEDYRLILYDSKGKELMPLAKAENVDSAEAELERICRQLEINKL
ncbi:MAG: hypothetical protein JZU47_20130 [Prolixibacteraceae bacterium]|nr:hypothetical protein [Prolixibacteraceae bacterium]